MAQPRFDLYTDVHKGIRNIMSQVSVNLGEVNWAEAGTINAFSGKWESLLNFLHHHGQNENNYIHSLFADKKPELVTRLEKEHREQEAWLEELAADFKKALDDQSTRLVLYRKYNKFLTAFFDHMMEEETSFQPMLWENFTDEQLQGSLGQIIANLTPADLDYSIEIMFPAMNLGECINMLGGMQFGMPPEVFGPVTKKVQSVIPEAKWAAIKTALNLP